MKVLDKEALFDYINKVQKKIHLLQTQLIDIQKAIKGVVELDDVLKGKAGSAIRSFYADVHEPILVLLKNFLATYYHMLNQLKESLHSFEPANYGFIRQSFLEQDIEQGLKRLEQITQGLTDEVNHEITKIQDIIQLSPLDDSYLLHRIQQAKVKKNHVLEQLYVLDSSKVKTLEPMMEDLLTMKNYLSEMRKIFFVDSTLITQYKHTSLKDSDTYQAVIEKIKFDNPLD